MIKTSITFLAIMRSGLHATTHWLESLFAPPTYRFEPRKLGFYKDNVSGMLAIVKDFNKVITSNYSLVMTMHEDLNLELDHIPDVDIHAENKFTIFLLRDFYNHFSSFHRMKIIQNPIWFKECWLSYARAYVNVTSMIPMSFNHWFLSETYRRNLCTSIRGKYSEETLDTITDEGSSFSGHTYDGKARQLPVMFNYKFFPKELVWLLDDEVVQLNRAIFSDVLDVTSIENSVLGV